jgi:hypothetical protein
MSGFSFHTEPSQGQNSGSFWTETSEDQQYLQDPMHSPNGFDTFTSFSVTPLLQHGQSIGQETVTRSRQQWNSSPSQLESEELSRLPSQDSTATQSEGLDLSPAYDQSGSTRMFPTISQVSYHMSSGGSDITGRSSPVDAGLYTPTQPDLQAFDVFHRDSIMVPSNTDNVSLNAGPSFTLFSPADEIYGFLDNVSNNQNSHLQLGTDSVVYNPGAIMDSPTMWEDSTTYLESHRSSPVIEEWAIAPSHITTSPKTTPLDYSPSLEGLSPKYAQEYPEPIELPPYTPGDRVLRKPVGPRQSKVVSDLAAASRNQSLPGTSEAPDESLKFVGRSSLELDNTARDHPLYQNVSTKADGLYHCPWEGKDSCPHKPEKLKCNYEYEFFNLSPYALLTMYLHQQIRGLPFEAVSLQGHCMRELAVFIHGLPSPS